MGCYVLLVIDIVVLRWYLKSQNAKKNSLAEAGVPEADPANMTVHGFEDLTDRQNAGFRYIY